MIDDPRIKGVAFTGSTEEGKTIPMRAGQNLKKSTMELGGSDAYIVLEGADLDKTVEWAHWAKVNNNGQCCVAADVERGKRVARRIDTGMAFVNHPTWTAPDLPFGGVKNPGYGRERSGLGIQEFVNKKLVRASPIDAAP